LSDLATTLNLVYGNYMRWYTTRKRQNSVGQKPTQSTNSMDKGPTLKFWSKTIVRGLLNA